MMKNFIYNNDIYLKLFIKDNNTLIKYSNLPKETWEQIINKKLDFINIPKFIEVLNKNELKKYGYSNSKIYLPYLKDYKTLYCENYTTELNSLEILKHFKETLLKLKKMHKKNIIHSDLNPNNIMINKDLDIVFIDFDACIVDDYVSDENVYLNTIEDIDFDHLKEYAKIQDKNDILNIYMHYLFNGNFKCDFTSEYDLSDINMPKYLCGPLNDLIRLDFSPNDNYYYLDIVDELIKIGYESPVLKKRYKRG